MKYITHVLLALILVAMTGCENITEPESPAVSFPQTEYSGFAPDNSEYVALQSMSEAEREAHGKAKMDEYFALTRGITGAVDWHAADAFVQQELSREGVTPEYQARTTASVLMLNHHLLPAAVTPERQDALVRYAEMAADNGSANAEVIDRALFAAGEDAPEDVVQRVAARTLVTVERVLDREAPCDGCDLSDKLAQGQSSASFSRETIERLAAQAGG